MWYDKVRNIKYIKDDIDNYILGLPIETSVGYCHFLLVEDYPALSNDISLVSWTKLHYLREFSKLDDGKRIVEDLNELELIEIVMGFKEFRDVYKKVFSHFFKDEDIFEKIKDKETFYYLRNLILKMCCISEEKLNPNPEIQKYIDKSKRLKSQKSEKITFSDMVSSISVIKGIGYEEIRKMTLYQLYMDYYRIATVKNHFATTVLSTIPTEKPIEIESWSKHVDLFEEEEHGLSMSKLSSISQQIKG